jgi:hypothetical protein
MNNYFLKIMVLSAATPDNRFFSGTGDSASSAAVADLKKSVESMSGALEIHDLQTVCSAIRQANRHYGHARKRPGSQWSLMKSVWMHCTGIVCAWICYAPVQRLTMLATSWTNSGLPSNSSRVGNSRQLVCVNMGINYQSTLWLRVKISFRIDFQATAPTSA